MAIGKAKFKERLEVDCFRQGFLLWAEKDKKNTPFTRKDITACEWKKIKNNTVKEYNQSHNL